jgi:hypothetical protein
MSKTGRGILRDPGPYFCLYSPECVEGEFSEVRLFAGSCIERPPRRERIPSKATPAAGEGTTCCGGA